MSDVHDEVERYGFGNRKLVRLAGADVRTYAEQVRADEGLGVVDYDRGFEFKRFEDLDLGPDRERQVTSEYLDVAERRRLADIERQVSDNLNRFDMGDRVGDGDTDISDDGEEVIVGDAAGNGVSDREQELAQELERLRNLDLICPTCGDIALRRERIPE